MSKKPKDLKSLVDLAKNFIPHLEFVDIINREKVMNEALTLCGISTKGIQSGDKIKGQTADFWVVDDITNTNTVSVTATAVKIAQERALASELTHKLQEQLGIEMLQMARSMTRYGQGLLFMKVCQDCKRAYTVPEYGNCRDLFMTHCEECENNQREAGGLPRI